MELKNSLCYIWVFQLFLAISKQNRIHNYFNNLKSSRNTEADKIIVNIIRNCYPQNANTVLSGNWRNSDLFTSNRAFATFPPLYKLGMSEDPHFKRHKRLKNVFKLDARVVSKKKYPCTSFILMVTSHHTLALTLKMLKESILWNHEGFFLIIYKNQQDQCSSVKSLLYLAWKFRLLSVTLLCQDDQGTLRLFTFNPYAKLAPKFWSFVQRHADRENAWFLYQHEINSSSTVLYPTICKNLNFKKTTNLGGYPVRMGAYVSPRLLTYDKQRSGARRFGGVNGEMSLAVWGHLDAAPRVQFYVRPGFVDDNGSLQSVLQDLLTGRIEFSMNMNLMRDFWRLQSYPHDVDGFCLVSRAEAASSAPAILSLALRRPGWPLLPGAGLALAVVLALLARRGPATGALEAARLAVAAPPGVRPRRPAARGLLALLGLAASLPLSGRFRGELTSLAAAPRPGRPIETEADLVESGLPVYGSLDFAEVFRDPELRHRYQYGAHAECLEWLERGERLACVTWCYQAAFGDCEGEALHVSKGLRQAYLSFSTAEDWPLYARFNELLRRLVEGGLVEHYKSREDDRLRRDKEECDANGERHHQLLNRDMRVSLHLWSCGVVLATLVFFVEICLCVVMDRVLAGWKRICRVLHF